MRVGLLCSAIGGTLGYAMVGCSPSDPPAESTLSSAGDLRRCRIFHLCADAGTPPPPDAGSIQDAAPSPADAGSTQDAAPPPADTGVSTPTATMLYRTDFSPSQSTLDPLSFPDGVVGTWQGISGIDVATGNQGPILPWGATNSFGHLLAGVPVTVSTIHDYVANEIQQVTGPGGAPSYALYQIVKQNFAPQGDSTQTPLTIYRGDDQSMPDTGDVYYTFWFQFQSDLNDRLGTNDGYDNWRVFTEWKTFEPTGVCDYRLLTFVVKDPDTGVLYWSTKGDGVGADANHPHWKIDNHSVPVPVGVWFKNEVFWHRSTTGPGRFWQAINGQVIVDYTDPNGLMGPDKLPINRVFLNNNYGGYPAPSYQWTTGLEIWDGFPCGVGASCFR